MWYPQGVFSAGVFTPRLRGLVRVPLPLYYAQPPVYYVRTPGGIKRYPWGYKNGTAAAPASAHPGGYSAVPLGV